VTALAPEILSDQVPDGTEWPGPDTVVLLHRPLRPGTDTAGLSRFSDDRWSLDPAVFEDHAKARSLNFTLVPQALRLEAKHYVWQLLNHQQPRAMPRAAAARPAVSTTAAPALARPQRTAPVNSPPKSPPTCKACATAASRCPASRTSREPA
jgi:hypothetical protein